MSEILKRNKTVNGYLVGPGASLQEADLEGADLQEANLVGADLRRSNLKGANLQEAYLMRANLSGANLQDANLWEACLMGANLMGADLSGANLMGADLYSGADLRGAILDFSCFPLSCSSFYVKVDDRIIWQLICHLTRLDGQHLSDEARDAIKALDKWKDKFGEYRGDIDKIDDEEE